MNIVTKYNCSYFLDPYLTPEVHLVLSIVLMALLLLFILLKQRNVISYLGFLFVVTGGLQNLLKRVRYNCVLDTASFFDLFKFNLADVLITVGLSFVLIGAFYYAKNSNSD